MKRVREKRRYKRDWKMYIGIMRIEDSGTASRTKGRSRSPCGEFLSLPPPRLKGG